MAAEEFVRKELWVTQCKNTDDKLEGIKQDIADIARIASSVNSNTNRLNLIERGIANGEKYADKNSKRRQWNTTAIIAIICCFIASIPTLVLIVKTIAK